jgi:hypothetical protein
LERFVKFRQRQAFDTSLQLCWIVNS